MSLFCVLHWIKTGCDVTKMITNALSDYRQDYINNEDYTYCRLIEGEDVIFRISSWQLGLEIAQSDGWNWVPVYDDPYMIVFGENRKFSESPYVEWYRRDDKSVSHEVWLHFRRTVPEDIQEIVGKQFRYSQVHLLKALRHCPELLVMARSCPALFWLLVEKNCDVNVLDSWEFFRLVRSKRKEILRRLGYVGTQSAVKLLSKIEIDCFEDEDLFRLKDVISSEQKVALLRHFRALSKMHLFAAANHSDLLHYTFVRNELSRSDISLVRFKDIVSLCEDTRNMAAMLQKEHLEDFFKTIRHPQQLRMCHDSFAEKLHNTKVNVRLLNNLLATYGKETFPSPPAGSLGNDSLKPICTLPELVQEAEEMENCLHSWAQRIYEGKAFCFQILKPERGTIGIDLTTGVPHIMEIRLKRNQSPSPATIHAVEGWFESMRKIASNKGN